MDNEEKEIMDEQAVNEPETELEEINNEPEIELEVIENEPEVIEPKSEELNKYQYQTIEEPSHQYQMPPKKKKHTGLIVGIVATVLIIGVLFTTSIFMMQRLIKNADTENAEIKIGENTEGKIASVDLVTGAAVAATNDYSELVGNVTPSIVAITQDYKQTDYSIWGESYGKIVQGSGSGFIVSQDDESLLIVTNNHVVQGAEKITVAFFDDETAEATVKGSDSLSDLAVISIKMSDLKKSTKSKIKVANLGNSDDVKVGQAAIAIGNALGYGQSVTVGYISAKNREVDVSDQNGSSKKMTLLQTDAAINPGNSGGALLDINGNVIGINSGKYSAAEVEGMGYAIPISSAVPVINELMKRKVLKEEEKGYLGITGRNISKDISEAYGMPTGVYVAQVGEKGSAEAAGIQIGDIIVSINGREVTTINEVQELVNSYAVGTEITITIKRSNNGEYVAKELKATLKDASTLNKLDTNQNSNDNSINPPGSVPENDPETDYPLFGDDY